MSPKPNATGVEAYDHTELSDETTDEYVRFDKRNGMVGVTFPRFLDGRKISQGTDVIRRAELAKLIADPNNPMLGKAFVNRMWAHFMGRGFVNPVDDFGPHNPPVPARAPGRAHQGSSRKAATTSRRSAGGSSTAASISSRAPRPSRATRKMGCSARCSSSR